MYFFLSKELPVYSGSSLTSFLPHWVAYRILVPLDPLVLQPGIEPVPPAVEAESQPLARQVTPLPPYLFGAVSEN